MSSTEFIRFPTKKVKIAHLLKSQYNETTKDFITILGSVKRARIIATVIEKKFFSRVEIPDTSQKTDQPPTSPRMVLTLDDGTGIIRGINWGATETTYNDIHVGDDVEVFGIVKIYRDHPEIILEIVRRIDDPNYELLRDLEIKKQMKALTKLEKPDKLLKSIDFLKDSLSTQEKTTSSFTQKIKVKKEEIEQQTPFENLESEKIMPENNFALAKDSQDKIDFNLKDKIYEIILTHDSGNGVSFKEIQEESQLDEDTLKNILKSLEKETAIGETRPGLYQPL